ncbi:MAG: S8 family peptidase [Lachnospiraceae bacterium]|nr:S8 family peptidase [Lachnospiraceae bacterium]
MLRVRKQVYCGDRYTGKDITVAVLDTGISRHPDFGSRILGFTDFVNGRVGLYDDDTHGTHVTGILAGDGSLSGGKYRGIAPQCSLVIGKVLNSNGDGTIEHMLKGIEWILRKKRIWNIRILNISIGLGLDLRSSQRERLLSCVEEAWVQGLVVVAAAGNAGPMPGTMSPIGNSKKIITVGCHEGGYFGERNSLCEHYSGREAEGSELRKPDIVAPGTDIVSCNGHARRTLYGWQNGYAAKSGTSMSTPIVSGAAALCLEKSPDALNSEVKRRMIYTATDLKEPWFKQGWGMLNIERMLDF